MLKLINSYVSAKVFITVSLKRNTNQIKWYYVKKITACEAMQKTTELNNVGHRFETTVTYPIPNRSFVHFVHYIYLRCS